MVAQTGQPGPAQSPAAALAAVRDDLDQFDRLLADDQGELSHTIYRLFEAISVRPFSLGTVTPPVNVPRHATHRRSAEAPR